MALFPNLMVKNKGVDLIKQRPFFSYISFVPGDYYHHKKNQYYVFQFHVHVEDQVDNFSPWLTSFTHTSFFFQIHCLPTFFDPFVLKKKMATIFIQATTDWTHNVKVYPLLLAKFLCTSRLLWDNLHTNVLTLFGRFICHIYFHLKLLLMTMWAWWWGITYLLSLPDLHCQFDVDFIENKPFEL